MKQRFFLYIVPFVFCILFIAGCDNAKLARAEDVPEMSSEEGSSSSSAESSAVSSSSEKILPLPDSIAGFEKIGSAGKYVYVGTEDISAKSNERPKMKVAFSY